MFRKTLLTTLALTLSQFTLADNILIVMSDESELALKEGKSYKTGFYFNELMQPVKKFIDQGHTLTFTTPNGVAPTMDVISDNADLFFSGDTAAYDAHMALLNKLQLTSPEHSPVISFSRVEQIGVQNFDALYAPGGHAPMEDLLVNDQLGRILTAFHDKQKPTALVCHGPIALLAALPNNDEFVNALKSGKKVAASKDWIYNDYKMTVFSNAEEEASKGWLGGEMQFYPQTALAAAGAEYQRSEADWQPKVVIDRELITGQNPASANAVADALLKKLAP